jgi:hypothetical protein
MPWYFAGPRRTRRIGRRKGVAMTRLGEWNPQEPGGRLERLESLAEIRQLPQRYALAVDSRDINALVGLFVPEVRVGRDQYGRAALKEWFIESLSRMRATVHFVGNHLIDFDSPELAHGVVYCRDELERPERGEWEVGMLQYQDTYVRIAGEWYFERRKFYRWYLGDALSRPALGFGTDPGHLTINQLPEAFPTWAPFWDRRDG